MVLLVFRKDMSLKKISADERHGRSENIPYIGSPALKTVEAWPISRVKLEIQSKKKNIIE
jgi:hypothetical protein